jgi:hypothetical protein
LLKASLPDRSSDILDDTATAEFVDSYVAGKRESGPAELHWAAQQFNTTWVLVSRVNNYSCMAVTGVFPNYQSGSNNELKYICAGYIALEQLQDPMILYAHGGLLNPHIIGQLTHYAPIHQPRTIELRFKFDECTIAQYADVRDIEQVSDLQHTSQLSESEVEASFAASTVYESQEERRRAFKQRITIAVLRDNFRAWQDRCKLVALGKSLLDEFRRNRHLNREEEISPISKLARSRSRSPPETSSSMLDKSVFNQTRPTLLHQSSDVFSPPTEDKPSSNDSASKEPRWTRLEAFTQLCQSRLPHSTFFIFQQVLKERRYSRNERYRLHRSVMNLWIGRSNSRFT